MQDRTSFRLFYFIYFAAGSGFTAFRNAYFEEIGLSGVEIGTIGFLIPIVAIAAQPIWGLMSDWRNLQKEVLYVGVVVTGATMLVYPIGATAGLIVLAGVSTVFSAFRAPIRPVANSLVLSTGLEYGKVRAFGSIAFGGSIIAVGFLVGQFGTEVVFYLYAGGMVVVALILAQVPITKAPPAKTIGLRATQLFHNRNFTALLVSAFLMGTLLSTAGGYFSIYMRVVGASDSLTGLALALKTVAEALVFFWPLGRKVSYKYLLVGGCLAHVGTFLVYASLPITTVILGVQLLLGLGYAAYYLAAVNLTHAIAPDALKSTAQTFLAAIGFGTGAGMGQLLAGRLMDLVGVQAMYGYMAILGLVAAVVSLTVTGSTTNGYQKAA
ncbi:MFS transporter [Haladaptatus sp. NG-SE-30]